MLILTVGLCFTSFLFFALVACRVVSNDYCLNKGPEGTKMGAWIWLFLGWENGISCTGTGIHQQKSNKR
jgi:hypothetical protein